ncbi:hypothetical protein HaLaN_21815 [Haematococcus lacustris]|uniref:Uncharacterized protein n=1 Tax=Haematococcus lacustris TaxID=44745 RepID=A0A699ZSE7_HAELA|nr:hypothetical protein HaLaN_21815 [Haematococcus lacustris]
MIGAVPRAHDAFLSNLIKYTKPLRAIVLYLEVSLRLAVHLRVGQPVTIEAHHRACHHRASGDSQEQPGSARSSSTPSPGGCPGGWPGGSPRAPLQLRVHPMQVSRRNHEESRSVAFCRAIQRGGAAKVGQEDASSQDFSWRQLEHDSVAWPSDGKHGGNGVEQHPTRSQQ